MSATRPTPALVLASGSLYRRELLSRLRLAFEHASPDIDESPEPGEAAANLTRRLSLAKARALAHTYPTHLVIGSDQAAELDGSIIGKPLTHTNAVTQLTAASGRMVRFHTGLCLLNTATGQYQLTAETTDVTFRELDAAEIERYLLAEKPYDCAGSFMCEGLGISLFERIDSQDPNTLVGLPLIALCRMLRQEGIHLP